jgi:hypothetical protein
MILTLMLTQAVVGTQQIWTQSNRNQTVFENARIAFDFISQDLRGIMASDFPGEEIYVYPGGPSLDCAFITSTIGDGSSTADVYEIGYSHDPDGNTLLRWKTGSTDGADWDFLGALPTIWATTWGQFDVISEGCTDVSFEFFKASASPPYRTAYSATADSTTTPSVVRVTLTLVPPDTVDLPAVKQEQYKRTFSKLIFIGSE